MIIRFQLSLLAFRLFLKLLEAPGKLLEAAGTISGCGSTKVTNSIPLAFREHESDNSIPIITFSIPALPGSSREAPGSSRKLLEAAGSTKVIIRFQLSLLAFRLFLEAPGKLLEAEAPGSCREHESDNSIITFSIPALPGSSREAPGSSREAPGSSRDSWKLPGRFLDAGARKL